jgi:hypothetical protein
MSGLLFKSDWVHVTRHCEAQDTTFEYSKVRYANVYPGIDIVYLGNQSRMEHECL